MSGGARPVYFDSTVLSNFALTDSIDVIVACFSDPVVPDAVVDELRAGIQDGHRHLSTVVSAVESANVSTAREPVGGSDPPPDLFRYSETTPSNYPHILSSLDRGEQAVLHLASVHDGLAVTDDLDARAVADELGVEYTGSLGVLAKAVHSEVISVETADQWLAEWIEYGYYSPVESVNELL